jgi:hypothetical protein
MIGTSSRRHQYWQNINAMLFGIGLGQLPYEPVRSALLLIAVGVSATIEARLDKREVNWRNG